MKSVTFTVIAQSRKWAMIKISGRASSNSLLLSGCASYPLRLPHRTKDLYTDARSIAP